MKTILTAERLRELLHYNPETGIFTRLVRSAQMNRIGDIAGGSTMNGYLKISVDGRRYLSHRLAWLYMHGCWPLHGVDHRNGVTDDNRISNLRPATQAENLQNKIHQSSSASQTLGVGWDKNRNKWIASIKVGGKQRNLGRFSSIDAAKAAYDAAKASIHAFQPVARRS